MSSLDKLIITFAFGEYKDKDPPHVMSCGRCLMAPKVKASLTSTLKSQNIHLRISLEEFVANINIKRTCLLDDAITLMNWFKRLVPSDRCSGDYCRIYCLRDRKR
jgi:hypothetical protein